MFAIYLFALVLVEIVKRYALPALAAVFAISLITFLAGGSWLAAAGYSAAFAAVAALAAAFGALTRGW